MWKLIVALFGLTVPNGLFIAWLITEFDGIAPVLQNRLAVAFMIDCALATGLLAALFARRPIGPIRWPWFVALSLLGGLGFSIPFFWWLNDRASRRAVRGVAA